MKTAVHKTIIAIIFLLIINLNNNCEAQPLIDFDTTEYDFGDIRELGGMVQYRFVYVNNGNKPLIINSVHTSCGCTSPAWSKEPVLPTKSGYIDVNFDPRDRPGSFTKSIIVNSNATEQSITLYISGNVIPRPEPTAAIYPYQMFDLRLKTTTVNFNKVIIGRQVSHDIEVINPSKANITISVPQDEIPPYLQITPKPQILKPGEKGIIKCVFNSAKCSDFDYVQFDAPIVINSAYKHNLHFKAFVTEVFSDKDKKSAPELTLIDGNNANLGIIAKGETVVHRIKFKNTGQSTLKIRSVRNACDCITLKIDTPEVQPNQEGQITVFFDTENKSGLQNRYLTIVTNSAVTQQIVYKITAEINN